MGFLSAEELNRLLPAETFAYRRRYRLSRYPAMNSCPRRRPKNSKREFEARIKEFGGELARRQACPGALF